MGNKNDEPLKCEKDLCEEVGWSKFLYEKYFEYLCDLKPDVTSESLEVVSVDSTKIHERGLVYVFVIAGKIFKIGHTITSITDRVQSYNCGKMAYRKNGTCSTTNFFVLQSLLNIEKRVKVYAYFPSKMKYEIFGEHGEEKFPSPKTVEKKVIKEFIATYKKKPIGCMQR